jgi:N-acetylneuraminic acid mutarotase
MKCALFALMALAASTFLACGSGNASFSTGGKNPTIHNEWTWVGGANTVNPSATYGTQGTAAAGNVPSGRALSMGGVDGSGTLWLFGGTQAPTQSADILLNDLWKYSSGEWTWVGGSNTPNQLGIYGVKGQPASGNIPGARSGGVSWIDKSGNLWIFGGVGYDSEDGTHYLNDLWEYSNGQWEWMSGSNIGDAVGIYGTQGQPAPANVPGARQLATAWVDNNGNFWLFGGSGVDSTGASDYLNDFWEYSNGQWTWVSGSPVVDQPGSYGTKGAAGTTNVPGSRIEAVSWADASGNLWLFGGSPGPDGHFGIYNDLWKFSNGEWTWIGGSNAIDQIGVYGSEGTASPNNTPGARVSGSTWVDAAGNLWLFGGDGDDSTGDVGQLNDLWKYSGGQWTWVDGANVTGEVGTYGTMGTAATSNIPGARDWSFGWIDSDGNFWLFGGNGYAASPTLGYLNDVWEYQP